MAKKNGSWWLVIKCETRRLQFFLHYSPSSKRFWWWTLFAQNTNLSMCGKRWMFLFCVLKYRSWYDRKRSKSRVDNCRVRALVARWWNRVRSSSPALTLLAECRKEIVEQRTKLKSWKRFLITQFFFSVDTKDFLTLSLLLPVGECVKYWISDNIVVMLTRQCEIIRDIFGVFVFCQYSRHNKQQREWMWINIWNSRDRKRIEFTIE